MTKFSKSSLYIPSKNLVSHLLHLYLSSYPTQSPKSSETELEVPVKWNDKILKSPFYIPLKNFVTPLCIDI